MTKMSIIVARKVKQTKYRKTGLKGLLTIHDNGLVAVSIDHKQLFAGLTYTKTDSYYEIKKPSSNDRTIIMDRLFDFNNQE